MAKVIYLPSKLEGETRDEWIDRIADEFAAEGFEFHSAIFGSETWQRERDGKIEQATMVYW